MQYKKSELRSSNLCLLKRLQRIQENKPKIQISKTSQTKSFDEDFPMPPDGDFEILNISKNKNRLSLYDRRGKR